jgi:hypothetical protein
MIDNDYLVIESCSKPCVLATIQADVRANMVALFDPDPPIPKGGPLKRHPANHNCNEAAARF